jgi:hypothetical protein
MGPTRPQQEARVQIPPIDVTKLARTAWKLLDDAGRALRPEPEPRRPAPPPTTRRREPPEIW